MEYVENKIYFVKSLKDNLKLKLYFANVCFHDNRKPEKVVIGTEVV